MNQRELFKDNLRDSHWLGEIVSNEDPQNLGRCRIRVFGKFDLIANEDLPWAAPCTNNMHGQFAVPKVGDIVSVRFDNGNLYQPMYWFQVLQDKDMVAKVAANGALKVVSFFYDPDRMQFYWAADEGLKLITTEGDGEINVPNVLRLVGAGGGSEEPAVLGDKNAKVLEDIIAEVKAIQNQITAFATAFTAAASAGAPLPIFSAAPFVAAAATLQAQSATVSATVNTLNTPAKANVASTKSDNVRVN